jgi:polar amino acid transport system substrate-binding protein
MRPTFANCVSPARFTGPAFFLVLACLLAAGTVSPRARAAPMNDHKVAEAALADLKAAIGEIVRADQSYATDKKVYYRSSQRAINALEGTHGSEFVAAAGSAGDEAGAIGHIDALLNRKATPVWAAPLDGAEANIQAAVAHLLDAGHAHDLMAYDIAVSRALTYLEVALGRPTEVGVLGGMEGALANTVLGVPDGATVQDGCAEPSAAPSYGVHDGYVAWVALPAKEGTQALADNAGEQSVVVRNGMIILRTAAAEQVVKACNTHAEVAPSPPAHSAAATAQPVPEKTAAAKAPAAAGAPASGAPALYTKDQAQAGAALFTAKCVLCHGENLQGTAAPSVAGHDFLNSAKKNGWTLEALRYLVFENMPFNAPHSLSPAEYADALAFILASNCYPAGGTPFPTANNPEFAKIMIGPVPGAHPGENSFGVCPVD